MARSGSIMRSYESMEETAEKGKREEHEIKYSSPLAGSRWRRDTTEKGKREETLLRRRLQDREGGRGREMGERIASAGAYKRENRETVQE